MSITRNPRISAEQYRALQRPVELPSPQQLFDQIVETLAANDLMKYEQADPFRNSIPNGLFNLIPPRPADLDLSRLMSLIEVNGKNGESDLEWKYLKDKIAVPDGAYLLLGIEDGNGRLNTTPSVSEENILAMGRSPYTVFEGIIHGIVFPEIFTTHNMDIWGSRYCPDREPIPLSPYLYLQAGRPLLSADWRNNAFPRGGMPSCRSRMCV